MPGREERREEVVDEVGEREDIVEGEMRNRAASVGRYALLVSSYSFESEVKVFDVAVQRFM